VEKGLTGQADFCETLMKLAGISLGKHLTG
jgi:hypothetical protein